MTEKDEPEPRPDPHPRRNDKPTATVVPFQSVARRKLPQPPKPPPTGPKGPPSAA